jgi:hypothetical protein
LIQLVRGHLIKLDLQAFKQANVIHGDRRFITRFDEIQSESLLLERFRIID